MNVNLTCFAPLGCEVGEGPFWWEHSLWWVDINPGLLHRCSGIGQTVSTWNLGDRTGAVVPVKGTKDTFIIAQQSGIHRIRLKGDQMAEKHFICDPEIHLPDNRFNDGKCDPLGRFWAGTMSRAQVKEVSALYCLKGDGKIDIKIDHVTISNGLDWSPDGRTFYYIDTPTRKIDAFDFNPESAQISNRRTIVDCPQDWGMPDGMTVDEEGMLWIAFWDGGAVRRIAPLTGRELLKISFPCSRVTSCCFGGETLEDLFITTARGVDNACVNQPEAGHVFTCRPGVRGRATRPFTIA